MRFYYALNKDNKYIIGFDGSIFKEKILMTIDTGLRTLDASLAQRVCAFLNNNDARMRYTNKELTELLLLKKEK